MFKKYMSYGLLVVGRNVSRPRIREQGMSSGYDCKWLTMQGTFSYIQKYCKLGCGPVVIYNQSRSIISYQTGKSLLIYWFNNKILYSRFLFAILADVERLTR